MKIFIVSFQKRKKQKSFIRKTFRFPNRSWIEKINEDNRSEFIQALEEEIENVHKFYVLKEEELAHVRLSINNTVRNLYNLPFEII
jgi:hypothetical protein